jgi:mRNA-degrading endonuclease RelE of RelBE toxin-antitoxin system
MSYNVSTIPAFDSELKTLAKKYHSLKGEYKDLVKHLEANPTEGADHIGQGCYKIRLAIKSKGRGKSGGARVAYFIQLQPEGENPGEVVLLTIFDKADRSTITTKELSDILKNL